MKLGVRTTLLLAFHCEWLQMIAASPLESWILIASDVSMLDAPHMLSYGIASSVCPKPDGEV